MLDKTDGFFDVLVEPGLLFYLNLPIENLKEVENVCYYEMEVKDNYTNGIYAFQFEKEIYLFEITYFSESEYKIISTYRLVEQREIYTLSETFKNEFLTHEDLEVLAKMNENNIVSSIKLDFEIESQIIKEFCKKYDLDCEANPGKVRFFGEYNGSYVIMVDGCGMEYAQVETHHTTDGIIFNYSSSQCLLVWEKVK